MYLRANTFRLAHLRLDGFRPGASVRFCPRCDFQYEVECRAVTCPACEAVLNVATITPDLVELVRAAA